MQKPPKFKELGSIEKQSSIEKTAKELLLIIKHIQKQKKKGRRITEDEWYSFDFAKDEFMRATQMSQ